MLAHSLRWFLASTVLLCLHRVHGTADAMAWGGSSSACEAMPTRTSRAFSPSVLLLRGGTGEDVGGELEDVLPEGILVGEPAIEAAAHMNVGREEDEVVGQRGVKTVGTLAGQSVPAGPPRPDSAKAKTPSEGTRGEAERGKVPAPRTLRLDLLRHVDERDPRLVRSKPEDDPTHLLDPLLGQWVVVLYKDGTNMAGILAATACMCTCLL